VAVQLAFPRAGVNGLVRSSVVAGSVRLWAAARHVTGFATLIDGAAVAGIDPFALHRQVSRGNDRGHARTRA
jgi:hypothetical protein